MRYRACTSAVYQTPGTSIAALPTMARKKSFFLYIVPLCLTLTVPSEALAQGGYFGGNKVQYRSFKFEVLKTDHFDIYYYPEEEQAKGALHKLARRKTRRGYAPLAGRPA